MSSAADRAVAIVGVGAILPDAPNAPAFWQNILNKRYSISEVPPGRWSVADYYDPDPSAPLKSYSKIGGWVQGFAFDWKRFRIPPRVAAAMDEGQQWAVTIAAEALDDYGYPNRPLDTQRTGVILGTAMGGELHYITSLGIYHPEYRHLLEQTPAFRALPSAQREIILNEWRTAAANHFPDITEDTMPGELPNIVSGRVANVLNLRGPNFITDAACASSFAAINAAVEMLTEHHVDAVIAGGVDRNMGAPIFVKFCKIGALSATGSRPFGAGADGFVMGEGSGSFLLKRLGDAERDGDRIYAVIRGVGASSDGKGKGITAPNPEGQVLSLLRAWENAGLDPATATLVEAHGTSTKVGDVAEVQTLSTVFGGAPRQSIALGSAKSNIGHLKAGAGAAGLLKAAMAIYHKKLPPTLNAEKPNPNFDFANSPFVLNHNLREWEEPNGVPRRAGVSAYGFGGANFHLVLEEHVPGMLTREERTQFAGVDMGAGNGVNAMRAQSSHSVGAGQASKPPIRGILAVGAATPSALKDRLDDLFRQAESGWTPPIASPDADELAQPERVVIDFGDQQELQEKIAKARKAAGFDNAQAWKALQAQGIFRGSGPKPGKIAFLFPGQGSQYINMGRELARLQPAVEQVFAEADEVMTPILGKPLTSFIFVDSADPAAMQQAEMDLMQTAITQPAMLTMDMALYKLLGEYGFTPDMVMGHSLGEYGALIAAGIMPFADALEASAARGAEMTKVSMDDNGWMAAVMAPLDVVKTTLEEIDGYVVAANINSTSQAVVGGASKAVEEAIARFGAQGFRAMRIPVSHAFHTKIVAPASKPLRVVLDRLRISEPSLPLVANVTGELYPVTVEDIKDILELQIASPVQWVKGLETMYANGVRTFVEVGPKKALKGFVDDVLGGREDVVSLFTNHPKTGELATFNHALCGLYAAGYGVQDAKQRASEQPVSIQSSPIPTPSSSIVQEEPAMASSSIGDASVNALLQALQQLSGGAISPLAAQSPRFDRNNEPAGSVVISGTGLGLPGANKPIMDPDNALRILRGEQFVDLIPERYRKEMAGKRITRLVKGEDGSGRFEVIDETDEVIKLAGRPGSFDLTEEYGVPEKLVEALDITTQLAMAAGIDALHEAGIPLVQTYRTTSKGTYLPERWLLPQALRDETGVIFASAFPGGDRMADEFKRFYTWDRLRRELEMLEDLRRYVHDGDALMEIQRRIGQVREELEQNAYEFDRRFIFRVLAMGHSQFAEFIGARGPNTHVNAACASTAQAVTLAEDWIRNGRCRRVIVISADDVTSDNLMGWIGAGFLATGAAATDDKVEEAALPFDRRRHGTLLGMGACALVLESEDAVHERGMRGIVELLAAEIANSAFHGTRLDVAHITGVMERLVTAAERRFGINRYSMAPQLCFVSHETYTPARGGSAAAEVTALRKTFGETANEIIMANTKGFTGHPMGAGVEDVIAVKILEYGIVPPVANYKEADPDLGPLNLSRGGNYPVLYALHLAAGFGSQIAMTLTRRIPGGLDRVDNKNAYQRWLDDVSGLDNAEVETIKRTLRVVAQGQPGRTPVPSTWQEGTEPTQRAQAPGRAVASGSPARMVMPPEPVTPPIAPEQRPVPAPVPAAAAVLPMASEQAASSAPQPDAPTAPQSTDADSVTAKVLAVVAEKTGYPEDMLDLDLDMEADLGIDTVKQAETFAAIREEFEIPFREDLSLRDYPTLGDVAGYVRTMRPDLAGGQVAGGTLQVARSALPADAPATPASSGEDPVTGKVLAVVAEKTGYPEDMLDLDLDMEADLGIDTVKQAETFAAIREEFDIPFREDLNLRDYPTLESVIGFVREMRPDLAGEQAAGGTSQVASPQSDTHTTTQLNAPKPASIGTLADADKMPRRVPTPLLRPDLTLCKPTGVTLDASSRVVVMPDAGGVGKSLINRLEKLGVTVLALEPAMETDALVTRLEAWINDGSVQGLYWLSALDAEPAIEEMTLDEWRELNRIRVKNLYAAARTLYANVAGPNAFLISATRFGGLHGYGSDGATAPLGGAVAGFTKAYNIEQGMRDAGIGITVKVVDFDVSRKTAEPADLLIAETLTDPGIVEVGYRDGLRYTVTLTEQPAENGGPGMVLNEESVFVVTGAAGGITSAIVTDLAIAGKSVFYLLDLVEAPARDDENIRLFRTDMDALKRKLIEETKARGERPTPVIIDKQIMAIERSEAALRAIESVEAAGGTAYYHSVNLMDGDAVTRVIDDVRKRFGKIDVLLHAGGLLIDRVLPDKQPQQFSLVFDVKADGFFNLLHAAKGMPIGATVSFSSVAGRFGNNGQSDYSAANDLLCKISSSMRNWRPETRGIAIDWTAWGEIGMASRGSVPTVMAALGIDMLPPEAGVPTIRRELTYGDTRGEVLVAGRLGAWVEEKDPTGGLDADATNAMLAARSAPLVMVGEIRAAKLYGGLVSEAVLDPAVQPFLYDHKVEDDLPWLPGVMGSEGMAQAASLLAPDYRVAEILHQTNLGALKFHRNEPKTVRISVEMVPGDGDELLGHARVQSIFQPPKPELPPQVKDHFAATVRLTKTEAEAPVIDFTPPGELPITGTEVYEMFFHGPAYQVIESGVVEGNRAITLMRGDLIPNADPADAAELTAPRLFEHLVQTAALWSMKSKAVMALPAGYDKAAIYRRPSTANGKRLYAVVRTDDDGETYDAQTVDSDGNVYAELSGYRTVSMG
ncbi:MAG: SDR family NAD(P)-dependent oxidoreductase [Caldilineaceae bacterium]|nr:SDR family NAD(P)-dependent oxidoreductase [Caldilineaceae bacterium]